MTINSDAQPAQQTFTPSFSSTGQAIPPFIYVSDVPLNFPPEVSGSASATKTLQLTNLGASGTSVTVRANGTTSPFQVNSNCGALAAGASCTAQIAYAPTSHLGPGGGAILIESSSQVTNDMPFAWAAGLNTTDPLQFSAAQLSFETVIVGQRSLVHPVTLTNATNAAISVPSPIISNPDFAVTANSCTAPLQPGQTCFVGIVYTPSAAGQGAYGTLALTGNSTQLSLVGTPMVVLPVTVTPTALYFGAVAVGSTQSKSISLVNAGSAAVTVNAVTPGSIRESDNCAGTLQGNQSCTITVTLVPTPPLGAWSGTLLVSLNGGLETLSVPLIWTATTEVTASPSQLDFGSTTIVGTTSSPLAVTMTNVSAVSQSITPTFSGAFAASSNGCLSLLPASQTCTIQIAFTPTQTGAQQGTMTVAFSDGTPSLVVSFTGTAVPAPPIVTFGPQVGGSTSATITSGQTASFNLVATASAYFSGTVTLTCSGVPANSTCSASPSSITLASGRQANVTVNVATGLSTSARLGTNSLVMAGLGLAAIIPAMLLLVVRGRFSRSIRVIPLLAGSAITATGLVSCSGGSSSSGGGLGGGSTPITTPKGVYTLVLTATSGSQSAQQSLTLTVQ